jgi:putative ABC transport system permease protein
MFKHNVKSAWRYLRHNLSYSLINLIGISIGIAVCLLIGIYIQNELSFDKYHKNANRIYRLAEKEQSASYWNNGIAKIPGGWGPGIAENLPEVQSMCRFTFFGNALFENGKEKIYEQGGFYADSSVFEIFSWPLSKGDQKTALVQPRSMVLTKSFAEKYFGTDDPLGKTLTVDNKTPYKVTGVMEDVPLNSHFRFDFLASMSSYSRAGVDIRADWKVWSQFYTYLLLKPNASSASLLLKTKKLLAQHLYDTLAASISPILQPLTNIHLHSDLYREMAANSDIKYIYIFGSLGLFIIIIACLNFINLAIAQAAKRMNEIGIRKANGASIKSLLIQYLGEAFMLIILATLIAVVLASLALPFVNNILATKLSFQWNHNITLIIGLLILVVTVGLATGIYPAIMLATFKPLQIIKNKSSASGHFIFRKTMVVLQFFITTALIIAALVSNKQLQFIQNKKLGFDKDQVVIIPFNDPATAKHVDAIKEQLKQIPGVESISASGNTVGGSDYGIPAHIVGIPKDQQPQMRCLVVDEDFLGTYKMQLASGRGFSEEMPSDSSAYLINEEAASQLGFNNPVGQLMEMPAIGRKAGPIIGVVRNFNFKSLHEKISPLYLMIQKGWFNEFSVRIKTGQISNTLAIIKSKWSSIEPAYPFTYTFLDETFSNMYHSETRTATLVRIFSFLAIFIACLGLFGLFAHSALQRTKEIGIRKVLGASVTGIVALLSKEFIGLIGIATLFAFPVSWWAMNKWLQNFAYRTPLEWWVFLIAGMIAIFIALLTISFQAIKAATANPVKSLKTE